MDYIFFSVGLVLLLVGADCLVSAASGLARRLGVSALTTAVVVVGFGTSMPELLTSIDAALQGSPALAIANVVGSNIANILLVLGFSALCVPLVCNPAPMRRDLPCLVFASVLAVFALQQGIVGRWMGLALGGAMLSYLVIVLITSRSEHDASAEGLPPEQLDARGVGGALLRSLLSIGILAFGAHLLVSGALGIAREHGISESVIGLTLVAIGTSLPELAVAVLALVRREADVAIGNIIGSNLFNILGILGITALISPLAVPATIASFDVWIMLAAALALAIFVRTGWRLTRVEGGALLLSYPVYLAVVT
ncbi:MAG: cation:H+ antiporter [Gammaproteobacteria bacterium]